VAADSGELDDDTAVDKSDVHADISTASFSDAVLSSRTLLQPMVGVHMLGRRGRPP